MKNELEMIQKRACKLIFGWESDYDELIANEKIQSLEERRKTLTLNFAKKTRKESSLRGLVPEKYAWACVKKKLKIYRRICSYGQIKK